MQRSQSPTAGKLVPQRNTMRSCIESKNLFPKPAWETIGIRTSIFGNSTSVTLAKKKSSYNWHFNSA